MISVSRVIKPSLQQSYVARNGGSGRFHSFAKSQGAVGNSKTTAEMSWLVLKGASAASKNLGEAWDSYLTVKAFTTGSLKSRMVQFFTSGTQA